MVTESISDFEPGEPLARKFWANLNGRIKSIYHHQLCRSPKTEAGESRRGGCCGAAKSRAHGPDCQVRDPGPARVYAARAAGLQESNLLRFECVHTRLGLAQRFRRARHRGCTCFSGCVCVVVLMQGGCFGRLPLKWTRRLVSARPGRSAVPLSRSPSLPESVKTRTLCVHTEH